ncbi:MAG: outer membrane beta-barrel protein [Weeksellaceae bacterium]
MKRSLLFLVLIIAGFAQAQIGVKAGLTYNADDGLYKSVENTYTNKGKGSMGYHVGIYKKFALTGLYVQPELWYVNYKNEFENQAGKDIDVKYKRIDLPISVGTSVLRLGYVQAGPVFSYYFDDKINIDEISEIEQTDIAVALQLGAGLSFQNYDIMLRYDFPLGDRETKWLQNSDYEFVTENSPKLLHVSVGYRF